MITRQHSTGRRRGFFSRWRRALGIIAAGLVAFTAVGLWLSAPDAEANLATEQADTARLLQDILTIQKRYAAEQNRPLARGTHAKGTCATAEFTINDLASTIPDRALATRLARGIYARPGTYPANIRFANGESHVFADSHPDVRAMSFSVDLTGPTADAVGVTRQDFSMNNATTFPLNDAHEFAVATQVATASGIGAGFLSLPFKDKFGFARIAVLGKQQQTPPKAAYQNTRYWSTVPYAHGPDEVVKYSALPCASNTARPLNEGPNALQDELTRSIDGDVPAACFDFALQLLDETRMTRLGMKRSRTYWTENASVEWDEAQAPFHVVGRVTLTPKSVMDADACNQQYIDVTEHATADSKPLGSINRARWSAESASRKARLAR